jgi:arginyl-tRNA synthetase
MDYSNIYKSLKEIICSTTIKLYGKLENLDKVAIEIPKNKDHGDLSCNISMIISKNIGKPPRVIAEEISEALKYDFIEKIDVAGSGFINFKFTTKFWHNVLNSIISKDSDYGRIDIGKNENVNIEFVSANPTGPMHIGHARGAIFGDVLSRVLEYVGFKVTREYYVNDAGGQIAVLVKSAHLRYLEHFGEIVEITEGLYPGEYLVEASKDIKQEFGDKFLELKESNLEEFTKIVLEKMLGIIKLNLSELGVKHDLFFSEKSLHDKNSDFYIENTFDILKKDGLIYEGRLPKPKGNDDQEWEDREQLLFKSSSFGDDQDRSLTKSDGSYTYFAGDVAYAKTKIDRGFKRNFLILGADHIGYVKRIRAVYNALSYGKASADVLLCQIVNFISEGVPVKMSKRAGKFATVSDVVSDVGADILRFIMITRKNDVLLDFDLDLVKSQTKENPIFYVQYCQVRGLSVCSKAKEQYPKIYNIFDSGSYDISLLKAEHETNLIRNLSTFPRLIEMIADNAEIHRLAFYLQDLSSEFHSLWNFGKENPDYRFIVEDKPELSAARLALVHRVSFIIRLGLEIIGIKPMERM